MIKSILWVARTSLVAVNLKRVVGTATSFIALSKGFNTCVEGKRVS